MRKGQFIEVFSLQFWFQAYRQNSSHLLQELLIIFIPKILPKKNNFKIMVDSLFDEEKHIAIDNNINGEALAFSARGSRKKSKCSHCEKGFCLVEKYWEKNPELYPQSRNSNRPKTMIVIVKKVPLLALGLLLL
jgi:hypothetical protein